jgi:uncharacterized protein (DUF488 family)
LKTQPKPTNTSKSGEPLTIWTIGHSNRPKEAFIDLLRGHQIQVLVDVRSFPTSKISHFKREEMEKRPPENGVDYVWLGKELGGYRTGGYQSHMKTKLFKEGIEKLLEIGAEKRMCIMCMEADPSGAIVA